MKLQKITVSLKPNKPATLVADGNKILGVIFYHSRKRRHVYYTVVELRQFQPKLYRELQRLAHSLQLQL